MLNWLRKMVETSKEARGGTLPPDAVDPNAILDESNYDEFIDQVLETHNYYRKLHGVPPLELKDEVSQYSKQWAIKMMKNKKMEHSKVTDRPNYGENIYYTSAKYVPGNVPVDNWYGEAKEDNYQYGKEPTNMRSGHFTQVVWKDSKFLGVGAVSWDQGLFVVCNYEPPGNVKGHFTENVPPIQE